MLYECECNTECVEVDRPASALRDGMRVTIVSEDLRGTRVEVVKSITSTGAEVFTVTRHNPMRICRGPGTPSLLGYTCEVRNIGAARACAACGS
jgi:hypothetical protein